MLHFSKFEFFLIGRNRDLAKVGNAGKVVGVNWNQLGSLLEAKHKFSKFDFTASGFQMFKDTAPQFLVMTEHNIKWDGNEGKINSWEELFTRGLVQLRNNIAHGSKSLIPAPFTAHRTQEFITAARALIAFVAEDVFSNPHWEEPISFH